MTDTEKALKLVIFKLTFTSNLQKVRETGWGKKTINLV